MDLDAKGAPQLDVVAVGAEAGLGPPVLALAHRGWGRCWGSTDTLFNRLDADFALTRDATGRVLVDHVLVEEGLLTLHSRPADGDLLEWLPPVLHPVLTKTDDGRLWASIEPFWPSVLLFDATRPRPAFAATAGVGLGAENLAWVGRGWNAETGGDVRLRHRFGTATGTSLTEWTANLHFGLVTPFGVYAGLRGDARGEKRRGTDTLFAPVVIGGVELGVVPDHGWDDFTAPKDRLEDVQLEASACGRVAVTVTGLGAGKDLRLGDPSFATIPGDGTGKWAWQGDMPSEPDDQLPLKLGRDTDTRTLPALDWGDPAFTAGLSPERYVDGETVHFTFTETGACSDLPDQTVSVVLPDGTTTDLPVVDGVAAFDRATVGVVSATWNWRGFVLGTAQVVVAPWPACADADHDGVDSCHGDCDDHDPRVHPGALDRPGDGEDTDCDGVNGVDLDRDGFEATHDVDDDPTVHPKVPTPDDTPLPDDAHAPLDLGTWGFGRFRRTITTSTGGWLRFAGDDLGELTVEAAPGSPGWTIELYVSADDAEFGDFATLNADNLLDQETTTEAAFWYDARAGAFDEDYPYGEDITPETPAGTHVFWVHLTPYPDDGPVPLVLTVAVTR